MTLLHFYLQLFAAFLTRIISISYRIEFLFENRDDASVFVAFSVFVQFCVKKTMSFADKINKFCKFSTF